MFISCDWGTTSFRLRLIDSASQKVLTEVKSNQGIADIYAAWKELERDESERISFYQSILKNQLKELQQQVNDRLHGLPIIISGMASSNIGMIELPYKTLPFSIDGSNLEIKNVKATEAFPHAMMIISGARTNHDVMRGEEVQLMGCDFLSSEERIYILPGTHSKHVTIKDQKVIDFMTYMTGEFFHLLSHHSILSRSVHEEIRSFSGSRLKAFEDGVEQSAQHNILRNAFLVRTNQLFDRYSKEENHHYLSGLLIGTELKELALRNVAITIVASTLMRRYYSIALQKLGHRQFEFFDADEALVKGHCKVFQLHQE